jgi:hypothetical protein
MRDIGDVRMARNPKNSPVPIPGIGDVRMAQDTETRERTATALIGWYDDGRYRRRVEAEITLREREQGTELSVTATGGRAYKASGEFRLDSIGDPLDYHAGQATSEVEAVTDFAPGWDAMRAARLVDIWRRWHLNGMQAACEHQRAEGWTERPIDPSKPLDTYGVHFEGQRSASWNMLAWVRPDEHPDGLLGKPCETCGYRYGSAWLFEPLPADVLDFAESIIDQS